MTSIIDLTVDPPVVRREVASPAPGRARRVRRPETSFYGRFILVRATIAVVLLPPFIGGLLLETSTTTAESAVGLGVLAAGCLNAIGVGWLVLDRLRGRRQIRRASAALMADARDRSAGPAPAEEGEVAVPAFAGR